MNLLIGILKNVIPFEYFLFCGYARNCLYLLLKSLDLNEDDEIIVPAFTCPSIYKIIEKAGVGIKYVDCEEDTLNICPDKLQKAISNKTKLIYVVHTYGTAASIEKIVNIAKKKGVLVIEDIAHSLFMEYNYKKLGTFGDYVLISFTKLIINFQGACIATKNQLIYKKMVVLQSKYKKNISHFKYIQLYLFRFFGSLWEARGSLIALFTFKCLIKVRDIFNITYVPDKFNDDFFYMSKLSMKLTYKGLKKAKKNRYSKFCTMYSKKIYTPKLLQEQTGVKPNYLIGILYRRNWILELFSLQVWRNPHRKGEYKRADKLYSQCRIFSHVIVKAVFAFVFNKD